MQLLYLRNKDILKMNFINADSLFEQFRAFLQLNLTFNIMCDSQNSNIMQTEVYAGYNLQINIINSVIFFLTDILIIT